MSVGRRLFLAVPLDDDTRAGLLAHLEAHGGGRIPGSHVVPANWHITLRFLGRIGDTARERVTGYLAGTLDVAPFRLGFGGLGAFPRPARATVAWLAVRTGRQPLESLFASCEEAARAAGLEPEERPFHPHLTLSRIRPPAAMTGLIDDFPPFPGRLDVERIVLYESRPRGGQPPDYVVIEEMDLPGA